VRRTFVATLVDLAAHDERIVLLTGDLGFTVVEPFAEAYPNRFFNVGVAEQNMVGLATGLADGGYVPYLYSIATFVTLRPYEFIRNGPILQRLPVRIIGVGGGFEYGSNGPSHYALEDLALMRVQPGMTVLAPADFAQAQEALRVSSALSGPVYFRLGKDDTTTVRGLEGRFQLGRAEQIGEGSDLLFVVTGSIASQTVEAADRLRDLGVESEVLVVASLSPAPVSDIAEALARFETALVVEAHYLNGGLGSLVCEIAAEQGIQCRIVRCGISSLVSGASGSEQYLYGVYRISAPALVDRAVAALGTAEFACAEP
jgi:transketolase